MYCCSRPCDTSVLPLAATPRGRLHQRFNRDIDPGPSAAAGDGVRPDQCAGWLIAGAYHRRSPPPTLVRSVIAASQLRAVPSIASAEHRRRRARLRRERLADPVDEQCHLVARPDRRRSCGPRARRTTNRPRWTSGRGSRCPSRRRSAAPRRPRSSGPRPGSGSPARTRSRRAGRPGRAADHGTTRAATRRPTPRSHGRRPGTRSAKLASSQPRSCVLVMPPAPCHWSARSGRVRVLAVCATAPLHAAGVRGEQTTHRVRRAPVRDPGARLHATGNELSHRHPVAEAPCPWCLRPAVRVAAWAASQPSSAMVRHDTSSPDRRTPSDPPVRSDQPAARRTASIPPVADAAAASRRPATRPGRRPVSLERRAVAAGTRPTRAPGRSAAPWSGRRRSATAAPVAARRGPRRRSCRASRRRAGIPAAARISATGGHSGWPGRGRAAGGDAGRHRATGGPGGSSQAAERRRAGGPAVAGAARTTRVGAGRRPGAASAGRDPASGVAPLAGPALRQRIGRPSASGAGAVGRSGGAGQVGPGGQAPTAVGRTPLPPPGGRSRCPAAGPSAAPSPRTGGPGRPHRPRRRTRAPAPAGAVAAGWPAVATGRRTVAPGAGGPTVAGEAGAAEPRAPSGCGASSQRAAGHRRSALQRQRRREVRAGRRHRLGPASRAWPRGSRPAPACGRPAPAARGRRWAAARRRPCRAPGPAAARP